MFAREITAADEIEEEIKEGSVAMDDCHLSSTVAGVNSLARPKRAPDRSLILL